MNNECLELSEEFETQLIDMLKTEFPELTIFVNPGDVQLMMPRSIWVRINHVDLMTIYGANRVCFVAKKLAFLSQEEQFAGRKTVDYYASKLDQEKRITGADVLDHSFTTIDEYRLHIKELIEQYHQLTEVEKEYKVQKKLEQIKSDF